MTSTHDRMSAFLDAHEQMHTAEGTCCTNLCLAAAFAPTDEPCAEFGSHPRGKHAETATQGRAS